MNGFFENGFLFSEETLNQVHLFWGRGLDWFMVAVTTMGNEIFYTIFIPVLYWCYNKGLAVRAGGAFLIGVTVNSALKDLFNNPRPDPGKLAPGISELNIRYIPKDSPGFPSGHAQDAVAFWGAFAYYLRTGRVFMISAVIILLIAYSRLYLGVHHMGDVIGGLVFGCLVLIIYILAVAWIEKNLTLLHQAALIAIVLILPYLVFRIIHVYDAEKTLGILSGFMVGVILEKDRLEFLPKSGVIPTVIKLIIGFSGVFIIKSGLKSLLPALPVADFFRYWLMGIWITLFAPLVFTRIPSLAGKIEER